MGSSVAVPVPSVAQLPIRDIGRLLSKLLSLGSKRPMDGVGAVGGHHVRLISVAAASWDTQICRGMGPGDKCNMTTIGYAHQLIN